MKEKEHNPLISACERLFFKLSHGYLLVLLKTFAPLLKTEKTPLVTHDIDKTKNTNFHIG